MKHGKNRKFGFDELKRYDLRYTIGLLSNVKNVYKEESKRKGVPKPILPTKHPKIVY